MASFIAGPRHRADSLGFKFCQVVVLSTKKKTTKVAHAPTIGNKSNADQGLPGQPGPAVSEDITAQPIINAKSVIS